MSESEIDVSYPYLANRRDLVGKEWKEAKFFSIAGWFCEDYEGTPFKDNAIAFGGYFKLFRGGIIHGELVDLFGRSVIQGNWSDADSGETIIFVKTYRESAVFPGRNPTLLPAVGYSGYSISLSREGWVGQFVIHSVYKGRVFCQITPSERSFFDG